MSGASQAVTTRSGRRATAAASCSFVGGGPASVGDFAAYIVPSSAIWPNIISGCRAKYSFTWISALSLPSIFSNFCQGSPFAAVCGVRFCRKMMSVVTSVPAPALKVVFGSRIAPIRSARSLR